MAHPLDTKGFFIQEIFQLFKATQRVMIPAQDYKEIIRLILAAEHSTTKTRKEYYLLHKFEVLKVDDTKRLIKRRKHPGDPILYFVSIEETFDVIKQVHLATGHGGRDKMIKQLKKKFANVTTEAITLFKTLCFKCQMNGTLSQHNSADDENRLQIDQSKFPNVATRRKRRKTPGNGGKAQRKIRKISEGSTSESERSFTPSDQSLSPQSVASDPDVSVDFSRVEESFPETVSELAITTTNPEPAKRFGARGQVDIIDMRSMAAGDFEWIMVYKDDVTKFYFLRPLASRQPSEVALELLDIFTTFGPPEVLQSDIGVEFVADIVDELRQVWPDLDIIHGVSRAAQKSDRERNSDIRSALAHWLDNNYDSDWTIGLKFVQLHMNTIQNYRIQRTPFAAVFGTDPKNCVAL